jgi:phage I-like protein
MASSARKAPASWSEVQRNDTEGCLLLIDSMIAEDGYVRSEIVGMLAMSHDDVSAFFALLRDRLPKHLVRDLVRFHTAHATPCRGRPLLDIPSGSSAPAPRLSRPMKQDIVTITLDLPSASEGEPPREVRVFTKGEFPTKKGRFRYTDKSRESVLAEYQRHGVRKFFDYRHLSLEQSSGPDGGRAAGRFHLEDRDGELWATDIKWTPKAAKEIAEGEWLYLSPAFLANRTTGEISELINVALTNLPATEQALPLVAAEADGSAIGDDIMGNAIAVALGLSPDAPEGDVLARLSRDREVVGELVKLSGKDDARQALGVVMSWKAEAEQSASLRAELGRIEGERDERLMLEAIETAINAGRVTPAERESLAGFGKKFGKEALTASLAGRKQIVSLSHPATGPAPGEKNAGPTVASLPEDASTQDAMRRLGMSTDDVVKAEAEMASRGLLRLPGGA